jgi:preprotein translocase subunit SecA
MDQAKKATEMIENKNYVVKYSKEKNQMEIIIVDFENTGRLNVGSRWSYGLHEFVEVKHKIKPKD